MLRRVGRAHTCTCIYFVLIIHCLMSPSLCLSRVGDVLHLERRDPNLAPGRQTKSAWPLLTSALRRPPLQAPAPAILVTRVFPTTTRGFLAMAMTSLFPMTTMTCTKTLDHRLPISLQTPPIAPPPSPGTQVAPIIKRLTVLD